MKFVNFKKILAIAICLMLAFDTYACFERAHKLHRRHRSHHRRVSRRGDEPATALTLNTTNPWARLAIGFMEGLIGNETGWMQCLKPEWVMEIPDKGEQGFIQEQITELSPVLEKLHKGFKKVLGAICTIVSIKDAVQNITEFFFKDNSRRIFLEGKFMRKADLKPKQIFNKIKGKISMIKNEIKGEALEVFEKKIQPVVHKIIKKLTIFKDKLLAFYRSDKFQLILKVLKCIKSGAGALFNLYSVIKGYVDKATEIAAIVASHGAGLAPFLVKLIWGLICNWDSFEQAINFIVEAFRSPKAHQKTFYFGKAVGTIVYAIGSARRKMRRRK